MDSSFASDPYCVYDSEKDSLQFRVVPSTNYLLPGVKNQVQVLFQIKTSQLKEEETITRPPLDLAIVLDKSGSMSGDKIKQSKEAIKKVIENLSPTDNIHFVAYSSNATVIFENGDLKDKDRLCDQVNKVNVDGNTNLSAGVIKAKELLVKSKKEGATQRIFLFSDGIVNEGEYKTHSEIFNLVHQIHDQNHINIASFGIGKDFDEDLMKGISEHGHSNYFYIQNSEQIEKFVGGALGSLLGIIGKEAVIKVRGKNGGVVTRIYGHEDVIQGAVIGDIKQNNLKNILVELEVTPDQNTTQEVATYELSYLPRQKSADSVKISGVLKMTKTENEKLVQEKNVETVVAITLQKAADMDDQILKLVEQNKSAEAIQQQQAQIELLKKVLDSDTTGRIQLALIKTEQGLEDLKSKKSKEHLVKQAKYHHQLKRMDSNDYLAM